MKPIAEADFIRDFAAQLERLAASADLAHVAYYLRMAALAAAASAALATPAEAGHCHRYWAFPYPDPGCNRGVYARARPKAVAPAPARVAELPLPAVTEIDRRTRAQILDQVEHDEVMRMHHDYINRLMAQPKELARQ